MPENQSPVISGAPCLSLRRPGPAVDCASRLGLGVARTPRRVARLEELRAPKGDVCVRVEAGRSNSLAWHFFGA
jgi:hypothetical protein